MMPSEYFAAVEQSKGTLILAIVFIGLCLFFCIPVLPCSATETGNDRMDQLLREKAIYTLYLCTAGQIGYFTRSVYRGPGNDHLQYPFCASL